MNTTVRTPAKINLTLDILGKRQDGYHDLSMIMQTVDLCDVLTLEEGEGGIQVGCTDPRIPCDPSNLVYKAARVIMEKTGIQKGIRIHIQKNIPLEAGLAGGSANAAGVLKGLNAMWELDLSLETLMELGNTIGADVPFCLLGGTALAEGTGNILTPLPPLPEYHVVLVKPDFGISTGWAFSHFKATDRILRPDNRRMCQAIRKGDRKAIESGLVNVFEPGTFEAYPLLQQIKEDFTRLGADGCLMSGSGPTMYGLFRDRNKAEKIRDHFRALYGETYLAGTC